MDIGISTVVFNKDKTKVLLQKREDLRIWTVPGGAIGADESPAEAAARETREETGIEIEPIRITGIYLRDIRFFEAINLTFLCQPIGGKLKTSSESVAVSWMPISQAIEKTRGVSADKIEDALKDNKEIILRTSESPKGFSKKLLLKWFFIQIKRKIKRLF